MTSIKKSKKQESKYETEADPEYDELVEALDKSAKLINHYSNENYDLKQEIDVHKKIRGVMETDYKDMQRKLMTIEASTDKVKEKGRGLQNLLHAIGNSTTEEYKQKSKKVYEDMTRKELEQWNRIKNNIN